MSDTDGLVPPVPPVAPAMGATDISRLQKSPISGNYVAQAAPGFDIEGLWHCFGTQHRTGYATHACALHWMLSDELKIRTYLVPHRNMHIDIERFPKDREDMLLRWHKDVVGVPRAMFCSFPPEVASQMEVIVPYVPYCAFEGTTVSEYCRDLCNGKSFAKVWVVSDFVKRAMVKSGVGEDRVHVVRPMLVGGPWKASPVEALADRKNRPVTQDAPYTFGVLGTWQKRKGMHELVRAYFGAFKREQPVKLVLRTSAFGSEQTIRKFKETISDEIALIAAEFGDTNFLASSRMPKLGLELGTALTDQQVIEWLGDLDCYANPSYGEGLGIPHVWSKAQGVPMVSSGYGAIGDLIAEVGDGHDFDFPYRLEAVDQEMTRTGLMFDRRTEWGVYEARDLGDAMAEAFAAGRVFDRGAAEKTRAAFSAAACLPAVREGLKALIDEKFAAEWKL